jgi:Flp pilus assembly protein protease CpaA
MSVTNLWEQVQVHLLLHGPQYKFYIEAATVAALFYVGFMDYRTFKIRNDWLLLLLVLYALLAFVDRTGAQVASNLILAVAMFAILLFFYTRGVVGGGDVKLMAVVALWVNSDRLLPFSVLLLVLVCLHVAAAKLGWAPTKLMADRIAISFGPALCGALIGAIMLGAV